MFDFVDVQKGAFWITFSSKRAPKEHGSELRRASRARSGSDSVSKSFQMVKISSKRPKESTKIDQTAPKNQFVDQFSGILEAILPWFSGLF